MAERSPKSARSSVPTSCTQVESTVLPVSVSTAWTALKNMEYDKLAPDIVTKTSYVSGGEGQVGSVVKIEYKSGGDVWEVRITEFSERNHVLAYEITSTDPAISATSMIGELTLHPVTDEGHTFLQWTTEFSNDCDAQVISDQKYKKHDFFAAFKKTIV